MKLNITVGGISKSGYFNIDPTANDNEADKHNMQINELDKVADDAECTEIILDNILNYFLLQNLNNIMPLICKKLRHGGKLIVNFIDASIVSKMFVNNLISLETFNNLIFGQDQINRRNAYNIKFIQDILTGLGLEIESISYDNTEASITAKRK